MKIYSPSYKRSFGVKTHLIIPNVIYCVHEFESEDYKEKGFNIIVMPDDIRGNIARVRNWIKDNLIKDKGIIIDDDIEAIKIWDIKEDKPILKDVNVNEFIEKGFDLCEQFGCSLWGVNILGDKGSYREYTPFSLNNTVSGSFMGFLNNDLIFDETIPLKEDYDFCIQTLNKYRKLLRLNYAHLIKKDHKNKGGCADYRTTTKEKEQMDLFIKKWGSNIVRVDKKKENKKNNDINPVVNIPIKGI
jgi:hypothetical protein